MSFAPAREDALRGWLAGELGGEVVAWERVGRGNSRHTYAADVRRGGELLALVVRHDDGRGPVAGTPLSLEHEATAYRALEGRGLPVPVVRASAPGLLALDRLPGRPGQPDAARGDYVRWLAALHRLPADELGLPGFARTAAAELDLWEEIARVKLGEPVELVALALEALRAEFPGEPERVVLCHGDAGDGNFLHEDGRVTAMLDWEFSHLGDPHDDLAWMTVRTAMHGRRLDGFAGLVRERYGGSLSPERLRYWQKVVLLRNVICCLAMLDGERERSVYYALLPGLVGRLVEALGERARDAALELLPRLSPVPVPPLPGLEG
jgi:aminoglycoside phosphotransferase (APT) family kinase protein